MDVILGDGGIPIRVGQDEADDRGEILYLGSTTLVAAVGRDDNKQPYLHIQFYGPESRLGYIAELSRDGSSSAQSAAMDGSDKLVLGNLAPGGYSLRFIAAGSSPKCD